MSDRLNAEQLRAVRALYKALPPLRLRHCPLAPTPKQEAFLRISSFEVFFGGAAAGGKTFALLMSALQYVDVPGYDALLLRPSLTELQLPGGLIELSHDWLAGTKAQWLGDLKQWRFTGPSRRGTGGETLGFGFLDNPNDVARYAGASYSYLGFDELGRFSEQQYLRMLRVLRQPHDRPDTVFPAAKDGTRLPDIPLRVRSASNPGGPNHSWIKARFVEPASRHPGAIYIPAKLIDNPFVNRQEYEQTLAHLPSVDRARLLNADWNIPDEGELFQRGWFEIVDRHMVPERTRAVRFWDLAATEPTSANPDPDYTAGLRLELDERTGSFYITDLIRTRKAAGAIEHLVADTAELDGHSVEIRIEEEPGGAGRAVSDRYRRHILRGYTVHCVRPTGPKDVRARPVAAAAENGLIKVVNGRHIADFLDEVSAFPHAAHDDCVDALAGAHQHISRQPRSGALRTSVARGRIPTSFAIIANRAQRFDYGQDPIDRIAAAIGAQIYDTRNIDR